MNATTFQSIPLTKEEAYWLQQCSEEMSISSFADYEGNTAGSIDEVVHQHYTLPTPLAQKIIDVGKGSDYGIFLILISGMEYLLSIYTRNEEVSLGTPVLKSKSGVSFQDHPLILRQLITKKMNFKDLLLSVQQHMVEANKHQKASYEQLIKKMNLDPSAQNPLHPRTIVSMKNIQNVALDYPSYADTVFQFNREGEVIGYTLSYKDPALGDRIHRVTEHFHCLLAAMLAAPDRNLSEMSILPDCERDRVLQQFNETESDYPKEQSVADLFEQQVKKTPDKTAIVFQDRTMTYSELNARANRVAHLLVRKGINEGCTVGIMVERSLAMPVGFMGVVKSGGAYLSIDPDYPTERITQLLQNAKVDIVLKTRDITRELPKHIQTIDIDKAMLEGSPPDEDNLERSYDPEGLMYILFTSGTTGEPKGARLKRHAFVNLLTWYAHYAVMENVLLMAPMTFDTAHKNLFAPLIAGGQLTLMDPGVLDYHAISDVISHHQITTINCAPSAFYPLLDYNKKSNYIKLSSIQNVFVGGERINIKKFQPWVLSPHCHSKIINTYGPTECTDITTFYPVSHQEVKEFAPIPIGKPIPNTKVYILDQGMNPLPVGVVGELCVGGISLAQGYHQAPELTTSKFVHFPHTPGEKIYRSGDLARWLPDGNIEFVGRVDHQTKIRGFRVELGEIEAHMVKHPLVEEVVVIGMEDASGAQTLAVYFVANAPLPSQQLRSFLAERLPEYMVPGYITQLKHMPLNQNGKINRNELPAIDVQGGVPASSYMPPQSERERQIAKIWSDVLQVEQVGLDDNFFELGGHSLKAASILLKMKDQLSVTLHLSEIFRQPTIRELARIIPHSQQQERVTIQPTAEKEDYPVTSQQKRLFILWQLERTSVAYNLPTATLIEGEFDINRLHQGIQRMIERHDSLRTSFSLKKNELVQRIHPPTEMMLDCIDVEEEAIKDVAQGFVQPFDLEQCPLFRVKVLRVAPQKHLLLIDTHHIIFDGASMEIFMKELVDLYQGEKLAPPRFQYRDYAVWQHRMREGESYKKNEAYWTDVFQQDVPVLALHTDYPRHAESDYHGERVTIETSHELTARIRDLATEHGTTLYSTLLAAINALLYKYTGQEDITIGSPLAGRSHPGLEEMVGMFVHTLVMRNAPKGGESFAQLLDDVKEHTLEALDHEDYPFEVLVDQLGIQRDSGRNPLFDVFFTLENDARALKAKGLTFQPMPLETGMTQFDLSIHAFENERTITFEFQYRTALFSRESMNRMTHHFIQLLESVTRDKATLLDEVSLLTEDEESEILCHFHTTAGRIPHHLTLTDLFARQVRLTPTQLAVHCESDVLTYRELDERSSQLAGFLKQQGVCHNDIVAIIAEPSIDMILGVWAVLKAGGAYLPIDPAFPNGRIQFTLQDSGCEKILMQSHLKGRLSLEQDVLTFDDQRIEQESASFFTGESSPEDLAYVMYTSGTTGQPKGVMVEHQQIVNQLVGLKDTLQLEGPLHHLLLAKFTFDVSVQQMLLPLLTGGELFVPVKETVMEPKKLWRYIEENQVDVMGAVPAHMSALLSDLETRPHLHTVMVAGEAFTTTLYKQLRESLQVTNIINLYGPTEATVYATSYRCDGEVQGTSLPIGKPLINYHTYILDTALHPVPIGVMGELYIGGRGVARGYRNRPELTAERFIENPFLTGEKMYRTGDFVRWLPDGNIEYIGRADHQVKMKGIRIEPNEIMAHLVKHPRVMDAVVIPKKEPNNDEYLCAFVVTDEKMTVSELRSYLKEQLPVYMIPTHFVRMDQLPRTSSDKVDMAALKGMRDVPLMLQGTPYAKPTTQIEKTVASIWKEILGLAQISIHDHFFDLGGNSLTLIQMRHRLQEELDLDISVVELFRYTTIQRLVHHIQAQGKQTDGKQEENDRSMVMEASKNRLKQRRNMKRRLT
ncbi:non-ribosomal peptide synthetase [Marininema halotolerans]|uniref:Fengycin family lipopeptide synthetase D n=1 Tax=Marininema halotolerans TaxID=1155944 RepID=A0A1I6Q2F6_9BACL|nr:non-ribosomal peptide synthetase [Marininema halotolerans]SFS46689.1 fengycin family lipopeptide synthetase D [Marininema halotolerans]